MKRIIIRLCCQKPGFNRPPKDTQTLVAWVFFIFFVIIYFEKAILLSHYFAKKQNFDIFGAVFENATLPAKTFICYFAGLLSNALFARCLIPLILLLFFGPEFLQKALLAKQN